MYLRLLIIAASFALVASCGGDDRRQRRNVPVYASGLACLSDLAGRGANFDGVVEFETRVGCNIDTPIDLYQSRIPLDRPARMGCSLGLALTAFEQRVVEPAAMRNFGVPLASLHHFGAYACRNMTGNAGRLSEHAYGRAIDVSGFELADGTMISVKDDWYDGGPKARFLREVGEGACDLFSVILGPSHNADHQDHFHFDIGRWPLCDP